jgi:hypothetical protein
MSHANGRSRHDCLNDRADKVTSRTARLWAEGWYQTYANLNLNINLTQTKIWKLHPSSYTYSGLPSFAVNIEGCKYHRGTAPTCGLGVVLLIQT